MNEVTCNKCGTVHAGLSTIEYMSYYPIHDQFLYCTKCGNTYKDFRPAVDADAPAGVTIQPILEYINE